MLVRQGSACIRSWDGRSGGEIIIDLKPWDCGVGGKARIGH